MDRRIARTKKAIENAYFSLILEQPDHRITVTEIAQRADVDRKTFYLHYSSPEDILEQFCNERIALLLKELAKTDFYRDPLQVDLVFYALNRLVEMDVDLYRSLAWNIRYRFFWDKIERLMSDSVIRVYGPIATVPMDEFRMCIDFFASGLVTLYLSWLKGEREITLDRLGDIVTDLANKGIMHLLPGKGTPEGKGEKE